MLLLPHRAHFSFHVGVLRDVGQLLELIDAHDDSQPLGCSDFLGQFQNFQLIFLLRLETQVKSDKLGHFVPDYQLRNGACKEFLHFLNAPLETRCSAGHDTAGKHTVELGLGADAEGVDVAHAHVLVLGRQLLAHGLDQR